MRRLTGKQLRTWRLSQRHVVDGSPLTQRRVAGYLSASLRAWQYWEAGTRQVPTWLSTWIRDKKLAVPGYGPKTPAAQP